MPPIRTASIDEVPGSKIKRAYIDQDDHQRTIIWTSRPNIDEIFEAEQDANAVQKTGVFAGKKVLLGIELDINPRTKEALDQWIIMAGGTPIAGEEGLADCDVYITRWREGPGYWSASRRVSIQYTSLLSLMPIICLVIIGDQVGKDGRDSIVVLLRLAGRSIGIAFGRAPTLPGTAQRRPGVLSSGEYTLPAVHVDPNVS